MEICIDFDGTIVKHEFPLVGKPNPNAIEWIKKFQEAGAKIILFTMRSDEGRLGPTLTHAVDYLKENEVELYGVNENPTQKGWTSSPKAYGQLYIDDAASGCPLMHPKNGGRPYVDWGIVGPKVLGMIQKNK